MPQTTPHYNLLDEPWIPVLRANGKAERVGIMAGLTGAHTIRTIAASSPMDRVAILRFLLAVLMWCHENAKAHLAALHKEGADIPDHWLARLREHQSAFDLLGDGERFYQDRAVATKDPRPIADLLVEFPGADSVNHMRHVVHGSYGFCPACCAMGILRLSVWAPANRYYPASVNPGSAAYAITEGRNLVQTLCVNLPDTNPQTDKAPWTDSEEPCDPDAVARLAWRPRKLWLNVGSGNALCANCGQTGTLVTGLCIERGWSTPVTTGQQFGKSVLLEFQKRTGEYRAKKTDRRKMADKVVKVAPVIRTCRMEALKKADIHAEQPLDGEGDAAKIARVFDQLYTAGNQETIRRLHKKSTKEEEPLLDRQDTQAKKFWVGDPHLLKEAEAIRLPALGEDVGQHASKFWRDALRLCGTKTLAIGIVGDGQYVFHDTPAERLPEAAATALAKLTGDCADILQGTGAKGEPNENSEAKLRRRGVLREVTPNPDREHPEIRAALKLLTPNAEAQIRDRLSALDASPGDSASEDTASLHGVYAPVVDQVVSSVTPGSPLRRHATRNHAQALLSRKIRDLVQKPDQPSNAGTPAAVHGRPTRDRNMGGSK